MKQNTIHIKDLSIGYPGKGEVKVVAEHIKGGKVVAEYTIGNMKG